MWKETVMVYRKVLFWNLSGETKYNHESRITRLRTEIWALDLPEYEQKL
jgi:hypothetical protein